MSTGLLILGAGGHGRVVADAALQAGYHRVAFLDDKAPALGSGPFVVLGPLAVLPVVMAEWECTFVAIGSNSRRLELFQELRRLGCKTPALVHPKAIVSPYAGIALPYRPVATFVRGRVAFDGARVLAQPGTGMFVTPAMVAG